MSALNNPNIDIIELDSSSEEDEDLVFSKKSFSQSESQRVLQSQRGLAPAIYQSQSESQRVESQSETQRVTVKEEPRENNDRIHFQNAGEYGGSSGNGGGSSSGLASAMASFGSLGGGPASSSFTSTIANNHGRSSEGSQGSGTRSIPNPVVKAEPADDNDIVDGMTLNVLSPLPVVSTSKKNNFKPKETKVTEAKENKPNDFFKVKAEPVEESFDEDVPMSDLFFGQDKLKEDKKKQENTLQLQSVTNQKSSSGSSSSSHSSEENNSDLDDSIEICDDNNIQTEDTARFSDALQNLTESFLEIINGVYQNGQNSIGSGSIGNFTASQADVSKVDHAWESVIGTLSEATWLPAKTRGELLDRSMTVQERVGTVGAGDITDIGAAVKSEPQIASPFINPYASQSQGEGNQGQEEFNLNANANANAVGGNGNGIMSNGLVPTRLKQEMKESPVGDGLKMNQSQNGQNQTASVSASSAGGGGFASAAATFGSLGSSSSVGNGTAAAANSFGNLGGSNSNSATAAGGQIQNAQSNRVMPWEKKPQQSPNNNMSMGGGQFGGSSSSSSSGHGQFGGSQGQFGSSRNSFANSGFNNNVQNRNPMGSQGSNNSFGSKQNQNINVNKNQNLNAGNGGGGGSGSGLGAGWIDERGQGNGNVNNNMQNFNSFGNSQFGGSNQFGTNNTNMNTFANNQFKNSSSSSSSTKPNNNINIANNQFGNASSTSSGQTNLKDKTTSDNIIQTNLLTRAR